MANEFIARNGLIAQNNSTITGSLTVVGNQTISGSIYLRSGSVINSTGADIAIKAGVGNNAGIALYNNNSTQYLAVDDTGSYANKFTVADRLTVQGLLTVQNTITTPSGQYFVAYSDTSTELSWNIPFAPSIAVYSGIGSSATGTSISNTSTDSNGNALPTKYWNFNMDGSTTMPGGVTASSFTGSLQGTASFAATASYALNAGGGGVSKGLVQAMTIGLQNIF